MILCVTKLSFYFTKRRYEPYQIRSKKPCHIETSQLISNQCRKSVGWFLVNTRFYWKIFWKNHNESKLNQNLFTFHLLREFHEKSLKRLALVADLVSTTFSSHSFSISFVIVLAVPCNTSWICFQLGFNWDVKVSFNNFLKELFNIFIKVLVILASKDHSVPVKTTFCSFLLQIFDSHRELRKNFSVICFFHATITVHQ